jgi:immune inhibitor A
MSIWARYVLGWVDPEDNLAVLNLSDLGKDPLALRLTQTELWGGEGEINAVKVNLPDKYYYINDPYSGDFEWYGDKADLIDTTLRRTVDLTTATTAQLSFATWYEIEQDWDYGFVQVSADGGTTWVSLPIDGTTATPVPDAHPSIVPNMPGFTGSSGGWLLKTFDLEEYVGQTIELQFRYMTDWGTTLAGFFVDDIGVTADGAQVFFDDVELLDPAWVVGGWLREEGSGYKPHYYIMEWRNLNPLEIDYNGTTIVNFDAGLNNVYNFDPFGSTPTQPAYYPYTPGLLLFYRDFTYTDNWTGIHPGAGFMLVVDAHKRPLIRPPYKENYGGLAWDARVQSYDATFGLDPAADIELTRYTNTQTYYALPPMPNFNDAHSYWSEKALTSSVITPNYGLVFRILGQADDKSAISIAFGNLNALDEELYMSTLSDYFSIFEKLFMPAIMR